MVLTGCGKTVDYFDRVPAGIKHAAVSLSGGLDSALALYCLAAVLDSRQQYGTEITPYHIVITSLKRLDTLSNAQDVVDYVRKRFPKVVLHDVDVYRGEKELGYSVKLDTSGDFPQLVPDPVGAGTGDVRSKAYVNIAALTSLRSRLPIDHVIVGFQLSDFEVVDNHPPRERDDQRALLQPRESFPWIDVGKDFIAAQYRALGILDLSLITNSCVADSHMGMPCKRCRWCKERYSAFGNYDYGFE
jgi:hypothetical protein